MECGECTLCCELFPVVWLNKLPNTVCKHADKGCKIHKTKPKECSGFSCAYAQMKRVDISLRPDNSKVIFEKITDRIFLGTYHPKNKMTEIARDQIRSFLEQGYSVIMVSSTQNKKPEVILGRNHKLEYVNKEFNQLLIERYGSSFIHN